MWCVIKYLNNPPPTQPTSQLRTPHHQLLCFSFNTHHAFLNPGIMSYKSSVHIWDSTSEVCRYLTPCCNSTPLPSFHISNPQVNCQRALTQGADYKQNMARLVQYRRKGGRKDRVWRRLKRFSDGSARCKIIPSVCKLLCRSYLFSIWWISQNVLACVWEMFGCLWECFFKLSLYSSSSDRGILIICFLK